MPYSTKYKTYIKYQTSPYKIYKQDFIKVLMRIDAVLVSAWSQHKIVRFVQFYLLRAGLRSRHTRLMRAVTVSEEERPLTPASLHL